MDEINPHPHMTRFIVGQGFLDEPVTLIDVGCSGGIHDHWRVFGDHLRAFGFDPQQQECARLNERETSAHVRYFPYFVGLPADHRFHQQARTQSAARAEYFNLTYQQLSTSFARECDPSVRVETNPINEHLTSDRISVDQFVREQDITDVDFIKIDTDGGDLEALISAEGVIRSGSVLGVMVESPFTGSDHETENSFHNIDRFLRQNGYCLYSLNVNRYSRRALPAPFKLPFAAQTEMGQAVWGDALYFRNAASPQCQALCGPLSIDKLLKLACFYEIFHLNDCAAELIQHEEQRFAERTNPVDLLDLLTPQLHGVSYSHGNYLRLFREDTARFFPGWCPKPPAEQQGAAAAQSPRRRTLSSILRGIARRAKAALTG